jgi:DNA-binding MurR/RpiR family transcriptional regulator
MSICDDIKRKYIRLSKGQRKVAQFVMDNPNVVATQIASEVGRLADVSESTVIRFCYAMDYSGFSELQEKMRDYLVDKGELEEVKKQASIKRVKKQMGADIVKQDIAGIAKTFNELDEQDLQTVVHLLHSSKRIHFLGFRQSAPAAFCMYTNLAKLREQVFFIQHDAEKIAQQLAMMDEDSLLFVISLDDEYEDVLTTVEIAHRKNVKIVAIRDKELTKAAEHANTVLIVSSAQESGAIYTVAIFSLMHILIESMFNLNPEQYKAFREIREESFHTDNLIAIK